MTDVPRADPVLKWCGGKRWLIPRLKATFDSYSASRLVDPFVGGMSIPLGLHPKTCLISDMNPHLMNLYRWMQHGLEWDDNCGIEFRNDRDIYYENRSKFNALCEAREYWTREGALLFYYLNRTGFNGLCRFNNAGTFNVPFGRYKYIEYRRDFHLYKEVMAGWQLFHGDFSSLPIEKNDFIYADPPYDVEFTKFSSRDFTWADQERLANWLAKHTGPVVASNQATPRIIDLYSNLGFTVFTLQAPRTISCTGDRTPATEILAVK